MRANTDCGEWRRDWSGLKGGQFASDGQSKCGGCSGTAVGHVNSQYVATANDAAALLYEMDAVLRDGEQVSDSASEGDSSADHIFSHMSAYMEAASQ